MDVMAWFTVTMLSDRLAVSIVTKVPFHDSKIRGCICWIDFLDLALRVNTQKNET
jgi:hypothetical protein